MHDVLPTEIIIPLQYLHYYLGCIALGHLFLLLDVLMQVAMWAVLQYQVVGVWRFDDLVESKDVVMHKVSVDLDLGLQHL